ncbi:hypothetical protein AG1IA_09136 [Rhizoctonia solani AG-1 IA]|uniref:Uncharacterized protein n=1 Tax=Thanatephorus cucumeris (strain AG1-IA) TaxID=983506 RepID=L8WJD7_THACA|nr:hypothetical protein AG1IA_09136 [Rhizoctonia solani AG-1 IA]
MVDEPGFDIGKKTSQQASWVGAQIRIMQIVLQDEGYTVCGGRLAYRPHDMTPLTHGTCGRQKSGLG